MKSDSFGKELLAFVPVPGLSGVLFLALLLLRPVIDKGCFQKAVSTPPRSTDFGLNVASGRHCAEAGRRESGGTWGGWFSSTLSASGEVSGSQRASSVTPASTEEHWVPGTPLLSLSP